MNRLGRFAALVSVCALYGCTSAPVLNASWYILGRPADQDMYIAMVNEGVEPLVLSRVVVNSVSESVPGWELDKPLTIPPGEIVIIPVTRFALGTGAAKKPWGGAQEKWDCRLPVSLRAITKEWGPIVAKGLPAVPTSLPEGLETNCDWPRPKRP